MSKLFAFGCSFTKYHWPMWADILGNDYTHYENWGKSGAGNQYIFNSLVDCMINRDITSDDMVIVMWSTVIREDRWIDGKWRTPGSIYLQDYYDEGFIKYCDPLGMYIRDLHLLCAARQLLESKNIPFKFCSIMRMGDLSEHSFRERISSSRYNRKFKNELSLMYPSVHETIYNGAWINRVDDSVKQFNNRWDDMKGVDWPNLHDLISGKICVNDIPSDIKEDICYYFDVPRVQCVLDEHLYYDLDHHPTPLLSSEYLENILGFTLSQDTKDKVMLTQDIVLGVSKYTNTFKFFKQNNYKI